MTGVVIREQSASGVRQETEDALQYGAGVNGVESLETTEKVWERLSMLNGHLATSSQCTQRDRDTSTGRRLRNLADIEWRGVPVFGYSVPLDLGAAPRACVEWHLSVRTRNGTATRC